MNRVKTILVVSTYPLKNAQHGGQKRTAALVSEYKRAGYTTQHTAVYMDSFYPDSDADDIALDWSTYEDRPGAGYLSDLILSDIFSQDLTAKRRFVSIVEKYKPDIIEIEQAFLFRTVKQVLDEIHWKGRMINSSHNIEARLKRQILENGSGFSDSDIKDAVKKVSDLEAFASKHADWSIVCTDADANDLRRMGAENVVVASNGISREIVDRREVARIKQKFITDGVTRLLLFVGSGHPPNLTGYKEMIGSRVGFIPDDTRLVIVGGIADSIYNYAQELPNYLKTLYFDHVTFLGRVEEKTLAALLYLADQIVLPIVEGEGSNLKTAEAILADTRVVGTSKAFRSYEQYMKLPNIVVADSGVEFCRQMDISLSTPQKKRSSENMLLAEQVLWSNTLAQAVEKVKNL